MVGHFYGFLYTNLILEKELCIFGRQTFNFNYILLTIHNLKKASGASGLSKCGASLYFIMNRYGAVILRTLKDLNLIINLLCFNLKLVQNIKSHPPFFAKTVPVIRFTSITKMIKMGLQNLFPLILMSLCLLTSSLSFMKKKKKKKKKTCKNLYANGFAILLIGR